MASRVFHKLLLNATLRRERCVVSALSRLSVRSYTVISRCASKQPVLNSSWCQHTQLNYCTDTVTEVPSEAQRTGEVFICKLHGVPWKTTKEGIEAFLKTGEIDNADINFSYYLNGQFTGIVYAVLNSQRDLDAALELNKQFIEDRYISVSEIKEEEFKSRSDPKHSNVLKLTGLPFRANREDIKTFFHGLDMMPNGIKFIQNRDGQAIGIAYVKFASPEIANEAMSRNGGVIGERYITLRLWTSVPPGGVSKFNLEPRPL